MIIEQNGFIHHVFFWLKNADNKEDKNLLIEGLRKLAATPTIKDFHIGIPAGTDRDVVDILMLFHGWHCSIAKRIMILISRILFI